MPKHRHRVRLPLLLSRAYFRRHAKSLPVALGQEAVGEAKPREYLTGSLGWQWMTKTQLRVGECYVLAQLNLTVTLIGSKELPRDGSATAPDVGGGAAPDTLPEDAEPAPR